MLHKILLGLFGLLLGVITGYGFATLVPPGQIARIISPATNAPHVIGFLPYWLLDKAATDYSPVVNMLTYFGLEVNSDGTLVKLVNPREFQPGWYALESGKVDRFFQAATSHHINLSLLINSGDIATINSLIVSPISHADTLVSALKPLVSRYGFSDINLDIEYTGQASSAARTHFTEFVREVKKQLDPKITLTIEISPIDVISPELIDIGKIGEVADNVVLMAYDYHAPDSSVTGPIAPLFGAGVSSEYDVKTAIEKTEQSVTSQKLILGIPLYGYEWETLTTNARSAVIARTGVLASSKRVDELLAACASCSAYFDQEAQEPYVVYKDANTGTYHQIFYPDQQSLKARIAFAQKQQLGGMALWALGYESSSLLMPLATYGK